MSTILLLSCGDVEEEITPSEPLVTSSEPIRPSEEPDRPSEEPDTGCMANLLFGDLVITEVMANPKGADANNEWFEIYNTTTTALNLGGLQVYAASQARTSEAMYVFPPTITIEQNQYLVVGDTDATPLPAHINHSYGNDLGMLRNSDALIELRCTETTIVDVFSYETSVEGKSTQLNGAISPDAIANDNPNNYCTAAVMYDATNHGTPQAANEECEQQVESKQCSDNGSLRDIRYPEVGDLIITEVMANPDGVDGDKEWFEVFVTKDIDLNNLSIGENITDTDYTINKTACLSINKNTYLLLSWRLNVQEINAIVDAFSNGISPAAYCQSVFNSYGASISGPGCIAKRNRGPENYVYRWKIAI